MSSKISLDQLSPEELDTLEKDIRKQRRDRSREERKKALAAAEAAAKEHGFSLRIDWRTPIRPQMPTGKPTPSLPWSRTGSARPKPRWRA